MTTEGHQSLSPDRRSQDALDPRQATANFNGSTTMSAVISRAVSPENATNETLDRKFYTMMLEIDKRYQMDTKLQKHEKIRIEQWSRKLCQVTKNTSWKRNRNLYAMWLLDMILNKKLEKPFTKVPADSNNLDMLQATEVKARLTQKVKNLLNRRDKSEERKNNHHLQNQVSSQSQQNLYQVAEVDMKNNKKLAAMNRTDKSRSRSNSLGKHKSKTATFSNFNEDLKVTQSAIDDMDTTSNQIARGLQQTFNNRSSIKTEKTSSFLFNSSNQQQQQVKHARFVEQGNNQTSGNHGYSGVAGHNSQI